MPDGLHVLVHTACSPWPAALPPAAALRKSETPLKHCQKSLQGAHLGQLQHHQLLHHLEAECVGPHACSHQAHLSELQRHELLLLHSLQVPSGTQAVIGSAEQLL